MWVAVGLSVALAGAALALLGRFRSESSRDDEAQLSPLLSLVPVLLAISSGTMGLLAGASNAGPAVAQSIETSLCLAMGAPCYAAALLLGKDIALKRTRGEAAALSGVIRLVVAGAALLLLAAGDRIGLLEAQLLILSGLLLCWRDLGGGNHQERSEGHSGASWWLWLACAAATVAGILAGGTALERSLTSWVIPGVSVFAYLSLRIAGGSRNSGILLLTGRTVLWSSVLGAGSLALARIVALVKEQPDWGDSELWSRILIVADTLRSGPYLGSFRTLIPEACLLLLCAGAAGWAARVPAVNSQAAPAARFAAGGALAGSAIALLCWRMIRAAD